MADYIIDVAYEQKVRKNRCWIRTQLNSSKYPLNSSEYVYVSKDREGYLSWTDKVSLWSIHPMNTEWLNVQESKEMLYEVFVGSFVTNAFRSEILNFNYVYGGTCKHRTREGNVLYEHVNEEMTLDDAIRVLTPEELFASFVQLIFATIYGQERVGWNHGNLVGKNVLFRGLGEGDVWLKYNIFGQTLYVRCGCVVSMKDFSKSRVVYEGREFGQPGSGLLDMYTFLESVVNSVVEHGAFELKETILWLVDAWKNATSMRHLIENIARHPFFWGMISISPPKAVLSSFRPPPDYNGYDSLVDVYDRDKLRDDVDGYSGLRDEFMNTFRAMHTRIHELYESVTNPPIWTSLSHHNIDIYPEESFYTPAIMNIIKSYIDKVFELRWLRSRYTYYLLIGKDIFTSHKDMANYNIIQEASNEFSTIQQQVDDVTTHYSLTLGAIRTRIRSVRGTYYIQNEPILRGYFDLDCF